MNTRLLNDANEETFFSYVHEKETMPTQTQMGSMIQNVIHGRPLIIYQIEINFINKIFLGQFFFLIVLQINHSEESNFSREMFYKAK